MRRYSLEHLIDILVGLDLRMVLEPERYYAEDRLVVIIRAALEAKTVS